MIFFFTKFLFGEWFKVDKSSLNVKYNICIIVELLTKIDSLTLSGPGGRIIPPHIKIVILFERLIILTLNFLISPKVYFALSYILKKFLSRFLLIPALFSDVPISTEINGFT